MSKSLDQRFFSICPYCNSIQSVLWNHHESRYQYAAHNFKQESLRTIVCFGSGTEHKSHPEPASRSPLEDF